MISLHIHRHLIVIGLMSASLLAIGLVALSGSNLKDIVFAERGEWLSIVNKNYQMENPDIVVNTKGDMVVVWQEIRGIDYDIYGIKTTIDAPSLKNSFQINHYTKNHQKNPQVDIDEKGNFVVVWESFGQDRSGLGVFGQKFANTGQPWGVEFQASMEQRGDQMSPDVTMGEDGQFTVVWRGDNTKNRREPVTDKNDQDIFARRFTREGKRSSEELRLTQKQYRHLANPQISANEAGNVLVAWEGEVMQEDENREFAKGIYGITLSNMINFNNSNSEIRISEGSTGTPKNPQIIDFHEGHFLVVWEKDLRLENDLYAKLDVVHQNIKARVIGDRGEYIYPEWDINTPVIEGNNNPNVVKTDYGALISWQNRRFINTGGEFSKKKQATQWRMLSQAINTKGELLGEPNEDVVSENLNFSKVRMASDGKNSITMAWESALSKHQKIITLQQFLSEHELPAIEEITEEATLAEGEMKIINVWGAIPPKENEAETTAE